MEIPVGPSEFVSNVTTGGSSGTSLAGSLESSLESSLAFSLIGSSYFVSMVIDGTSSDVVMVTWDVSLDVVSTVTLEVSSGLDSMDSSEAAPRYRRLSRVDDVSSDVSVVSRARLVLLEVGSSSETESHKSSMNHTIHIWGKASPTI